MEKTDIAKYTIKDSIFTNLFQDKKYLIQLYRALHPEDTETTEDEYHYPSIDVSGAVLS